jgi:hypothetical protein
VRVNAVTSEILQGTAGVPSELMKQQLTELHATAYNPNLWAGGLVILAKACLLASMTLFISTFASSSIFTVIVSVVIYFIGHLQATAREVWQTPIGLAGTAWWMKGFLAIISLVFPDLQLFNLVDEIVVGTAIPSWLLGKTLALGAMYCLIYLFAAFFVFEAREL